MGLDSFHRGFYSSVYVCFLCIISLGVVFFFPGFLYFPLFPFGVVINSRVSSGIVLVHVCLSIPCPYSISLVGALNELCFSTTGKRLWKSMVVWQLG